MKTKVNAEGGELILRNSFGDVAIIPAKYKHEVKDMVSGGCFKCIDNLVETLPTVKDYEGDGEHYAANGLVLEGDPIYPSAYSVSSLEERSQQLTKDHAAMNWVQRGINPTNYPYLEDSEGNRMTHKLSYVEQDGKYAIFPMIVQKEGNDYLHDFNEDWKAAYDYAKSTNTLMETDDVELADYYSKNGLIKHF